MGRQKLGKAKRRAEPPPRNFLKTLGPGLITGASDDDPSGIATYSQAGAQFGFSMLWTMILVFPFMAAIQMISALIGRVTGQGIAGNLRRHYARWIMFPMIGLLLVANIINLTADLNAMGAALQLLVHGPAQLYSALFAAGSVILQIRIPYSKYANYLKWLCLVLFAYVVTVLVVKVNWKEALWGTLVPKIPWDSDGITMLIAILGTTISPYLFFWQASAEVEEIKAHTEEKALKDEPRQKTTQVERIQWDTFVGMALSNIIAWSIILTVAATLHAHGATKIESASQAAEALRPVAGSMAFLLFSVGIIGTGLLALPVLAGSAAYAVGEALRWPVGLDRKAREAKGFYAVIAVATILAVLLNFTNMDPIKELFWSAVINGVIAAPLMVLMMLMTTNKKVMGKMTLSPRLRFFGWASTVMMVAAGVAFFVTLKP